MVGYVLASVIWVCLLVLTVRAVISFVPLFIRDWQPRGPMLVIAEVVYTLTDPPLRAIRRFVKPVNLGGTMFDLAFVVLYVALTILQRIVIVFL